MNLQDTPARYGAVSVFNHWLGAALIVALLAIGLYFEDMPRGDEKLYWLRLHISIGALALLPLAFRVFWRARSTSPAPLPQPPRMQRLASALHVILLAAIGVLLVSGPLTVWSGGRAINVFDWFAIASPMGEMPALHKALETVARHRRQGAAILVRRARAGRAQARRGEPRRHAVADIRARPGGAVRGKSAAARRRGIYKAGVSTSSGSTSGSIVSGYLAFCFSSSP
ncbi:MAG: cytochrome b/b6 domain-containing protein [Rhodocyclaceae bacterium]|nr:cytochrome b/b6 domain-containing protein [Rhodocyclaceae bacterium]